MIPEHLNDEIERRLTFFYNEKVRIISSNHVFGGSINNSFRLDTTSGSFFLKFNHSKRYPFMFEAEMKGLSLISQTRAIGVPKSLFAGECAGISFIVMEFLDAGTESGTFWESFAGSLAMMHRVTQKNFGLDHSNYIGSLKQSNALHPDYCSFFVNERLEKQINQAINSKDITSDIVRKFRMLYNKLPEIIPKEPPALIHGDLWSGNFVIGPDGNAWLIDPSIYFGHREADIAMSNLFGGFSDRFYESYQHHFPMEPGWQKRLDIYNLYPLLVHLNLFGNSYLSRIINILSRFV